MMKLKWIGSLLILAGVVAVSYTHLFIRSRMRMVVIIIQPEVTQTVYNVWKKAVIARM